MWSIDTIPGLPQDKDGYENLVVAVDAFTKLVEIGKLKTKSAAEMAEWIEFNILARYGAPRIIRTDNGTEYMGEVDDLLKDYGIKRHFTSPAYPQANGQAERVVGIIKLILRKYLDGLHESLWSDFLPQVLYFLRFTPAKATGITPFEAAFGFEPYVPTLIQIGQATEFTIDYRKLDKEAEQ